MLEEKLRLLKIYKKLEWKVIDLDGKTPLRRNWSTNPPTTEEVAEALSRRPQLNIGIMCGEPSGIISVDVDQPRLIGFDPRPAIAKGALAHSTSKAPRLIFRSSNSEVLNFSRKIVRKKEEVDESLIVGDSDKSTITLIEVLGTGRQFVAPPSIHPEKGIKFEWITPLPESKDEILEIKSLEHLREVLAECVKEKWVLEELFEREEVRRIHEEQSKESQEWLERAIEKLRKELAAYEAKEYTRWVLYRCPFHPPDEHPSFAFNKEKFYFVDFHDDGVYSLKSLAEKLGIELPGREKEEDEFDFEIIASDGIILPAHGFFYKEGREYIISEFTQLWVRDRKGKEYIKSFLILNKNGERRLIPTSKVLEFRNKRISLKFGDKIDATIPTLMSKEAVDRFLAGETPLFKEVFEDVKANIRRFVNFRREIDEIKAALRVIESYFVDLFGSTCIVHFAGHQGSGKTRANATVTLMSRKGWLLLNPSDASTFRIVEALNPTIGIDEEFTSSVRLVLKGGYKKGLGIARMEKIKDGKFAVRLYNPFTCYNLSLKDTRVFDDQLKRRIVTIQMIRNTRGVEAYDPSPSDFQDVRDSLYLLRLTRALDVHNAYLEVRSKYKEELGIDAIELYGGWLAIAALIDEEIERLLVEEIKQSKAQFYEETFRDQRLVTDALINLKLENEEREEFTLEEIREQMKEIYVGEVENGDEVERLIQTFQKSFSKLRVGKLLSEMGIQSKRDWVEDRRRGLRKYRVSWDDLHRLIEEYYPDHQNSNLIISHISGGMGGIRWQEGNGSISEKKEGERLSVMMTENAGEGSIPEKKVNDGCHLLPPKPPKDKDKGKKGGKDINKTEYIKIKIIELPPVLEFVGVDGKIYEIKEVGQILTIPEPNAKPFLEKGYAVRVFESDKD